MTDDVFVVDAVSVTYGPVLALRDVDMRIPRTGVTTLIGPSGCGKSTLLRTLNRMNDLVAGAQLTGSVTFDGADIHAPDVDLANLRRRVGMVFQKPNPFPRSIHDNVAYGPTIHGDRSAIDELVEESLSRTGLWEEVKDDLDRPATALSGGQQQRLVIARCLAVRPEVILMDEPTASLDRLASATIEDLIVRLAEDYTIVLVTHDLQQASRISDRIAFFEAHAHDDGARHGELVEYGPAEQVLTDPDDPRTRRYVSGAPS
jgi:phosphate transport system ATP-binding protein